MEKKILIYHAFTEEIFKGNPAGIIFDAQDLKEVEMQKIAKELGYPETVFIYTDRDPLKVRFFTPKEEVDLCGHATIAYITALVEKGIINIEKESCRVKIETNLGILPIVVNKVEDKVDVMMYQASPKVEKIENLEFWKKKIAKALKITEESFSKEIEIVKAYTGIWDLMIGIKNREILNGIDGDMTLIEEVSRELGIISFHIFALEDKKIYARNMAPIVDIPEEAATGTSNGALIYYLYTLGRVGAKERIEIIQGESLGRKSRILGEIEEKEEIKVLIGGRAVKFIEGKIYL
mgnify:CR=1 FL=1|jgi:PhzF family phenazine biosynthesis protein